VTGDAPAPAAPAASDRHRWTAALAFAAITAAFVAARVVHEPLWPTDFDQLWHAARALLGGANPYEAVGPGKAFQWDWPLYYPLPAVLYAVPFALLPVEAARVAFSAFAAASLGWALGPRVRTHWPLLLSAAFIISSSRAQWAPVLLAAAWAPVLGFATIAKPNVGLASLAGLNRRGLITALAGCATVLALCFIVRPGWFGSWIEAIRTAPHIQSAALLLPAGPLLLLAALRWRRPEARLFLALVILPHTPSLYDLLLLFFACRTVRETLVLAFLTQALYWVIVLFGSFNTFDAYAEGVGRAAVLIVYLPVLIAILLRPNRVDEDAPVSAATATAARVVPRNWIDSILLSMLLVGATMLVWLPLVTYR